MKETKTPENNQYCNVKYHRISKIPAYLVKMGSDPIHEYDSYCESVWYNADEKAFYAGDEWLCGLNEVVFWTPADAPVIGLASKLGY